MVAGSGYTFPWVKLEGEEEGVADWPDPAVLLQVTKSGASSTPGTGTGIYLRGANSQLHTTDNSIGYNYVFGASDGIHFYLADNNNVHSNYILGNAGVGNSGYGISLEFSESNLLYNNYLNNPRNIGGVIGNRNVWTLYKRGEPNIVGGKNTGGNYWARPDGTGHSQVYANRHDAEDFISEYYAIDSANIDTLPLWNPINVSMSLKAKDDPQVLPVEVIANGTATGRPYLWIWDFGDGTPVDPENYHASKVTHIYNSSGAYTVKANVYDYPGYLDYKGYMNLGGASASATASFTAGTPGLLSLFTADPSSGPAPLLVNFTDQSTGSPTNWTWDFGDGNTSVLQNPTNRFSRADVYPVRLTVANGTYTNTSAVNVTVRPDATFNAYQPDQASPLTVQFVDLSTGYPDTWLWNFGDGTTSTEQNPVHGYPSIGVYSASLAVGARGLTDSATAPVDLSANGTLSASFAASPNTGAVPLTVTFVDQSTGSPTAWEWDFGDNLTSTERNPTHTYSDAGTYLVTLKVGKGDMWSSRTHSEVIIANLPVLAAAYTASPRSGPAPLTVDFTDLSTGSPTAWEWDFGDGNTSLDQNPTHTYAKEGSYAVVLSVRNAANETSVADTLTIEVGGPTIPVAAFTATPRAGPKPLAVQFIDQSTGNPVSWKWEIYNESSSRKTGEITNQSPLVYFFDPGTYRVVLTVTNDVGGVSTMERNHFIVVTSPGAPDVNFWGSPFDGTLNQGGRGVSVQFHDISDLGPTSWFWEFGDSATSTLQSPIHTYTRPGRYSVTLTASNAEGVNSTTKTDYIYIRNAVPRASFTVSPTSGESPLASQFVDTSVGEGITEWLWDFGDGATVRVTDAAARNVFHTFVNQGPANMTYHATLTVKNDGGSNKSVSQDITVSPQQGPLSPDNVTLSQGWNFVSVPKQLAEGSRTASQVFGSLDMDKHAILLYDAASSAWKQVKANDELKPLDGIWVYAKDPAVIHLVFNETGAATPPTKNLKRGWNAIGLGNDRPVVTRDALLSLDEKWVNVIGYHDGAKADDPIIRGSSDPTKSDLIRQLYPTKGYWIWMNEDGTLQGMV